MNIHDVIIFVIAPESGQVENLQMLPSAHAIELHWAAPLAANGAIEVYLLRYRQFTQADCETLRKFPVLGQCLTLLVYHRCFLGCIGLFLQAPLLTLMYRIS